MMSTTETTTPEMTSDWRASYVEPGTVFYADDPSEVIPAGWYVLGDNYHGEDGHDVVICVEEAVDKDGNDITEYVTKVIAERLREATGLYRDVMLEIVEIVGCGEVPLDELPGKVRELVEALRAEIAAVRAESGFANRVATVNDQEWSEADDECTQLRAEVERLTAENTELRRAVQLAEEAQSDAEVRAAKVGA